MSFTRLSRGHVLAAAAALALMLAMAADWYTTATGEQIRRDQSVLPDLEPGTVIAEEVEAERQRGSYQAEEEERNAWQASGVLDRFILALLVGSVVLALAAAALRAANRRYPPPLTPSAIAAMVAAVAALLVAIRIVVEGVLVTGGQVEAGAPLGLLAVGLLALGAALAARAERADRAVSETRTPTAL